MSIRKLYKSGDFMLYDMDVTGKKKTVSTLYFKGNVDKRIRINEICAVEDGVVLFAGRDYDAHHRASRLKTHVTITGKGGVVITYAFLTDLTVNVGDTVKVGDVIGHTDSKLKIAVQCRRNDRFIDACNYFNIERKNIQFNVKDTNELNKEIVCEACELTDPMRNHIDRYFNAEGLWERLARGICRDDWRKRS